jgi:hypothetical protein
MKLYIKGFFPPFNTVFLFALKTYESKPLKSNFCFETTIADLISVWGYRGTASVVQWSEFLATDPEVRVRLPVLPDFRRSSGFGTGFTQYGEYKWGGTWKKKYPQKLALTSPTTGSRSVGIVRSRTKATEIFGFFGASGDRLLTGNKSKIVIIIWYEVRNLLHTRY